MRDFILLRTLSPTQGLGGQLAKLGIPGLDIAYLGNPHTALLSVAFVDNWHYWGFLMVLFLSAIQNVPPDLYDAARVDGANRWQEFRHVTIPGIRPTVVFMLLMTAIWSFLVFDYIWILTQGGPAGSVVGSAGYARLQKRDLAARCRVCGHHWTVDECLRRADHQHLLVFAPPRMGHMNLNTD